MYPSEKPLHGAICDLFSPVSLEEGAARRPTMRLDEWEAGETRRDDGRRLQEERRERSAGTCAIWRPRGKTSGRRRYKHMSDLSKINILASILLRVEPGKTVFPSLSLLGSSVGTAGIPRKNSRTATTRHKIPPDRAPARHAVDHRSPQLPPQHADCPVDGGHPAEGLGQLADAVERRDEGRFAEAAEGGEVSVVGPGRAGKRRRVVNSSLQ